MTGSINSKTSCGETFFQIAVRKSVVVRAARIAIVVGVVLGLLNHGDVIIAAELTGTHFIKICLTFLVPYSVSTYSSVLAIRERDSEMRGAVH